ncbi:MAG: class I SAM-dependent methyltransferase [Terriglobales bacterium]
MNPVSAYLHRKSREKKYRLFLQLLRPTPQMRILNVGVSGSNVGVPEQLESFYPERRQITGGGLSLRDVSDYHHCFPEARALVFDGCALPFADQSFDIVYSNAVIEHLPGWEAQQRFAAEVQRVGRAWFVATPNLLYPFEPHYHLPLVQFLPQAQQRRLATALRKPAYDHLYLLDKYSLQRLFSRGQVVGCRVTLYPETLIAYKPA